MRRVSLVFTGAILLLALLLGVRLWQQRRAASGPTRGSAVVEGTQVDLRARMVARVDGVQAHRGARVEKGALLVALDCTEADAALREAQARTRVAQAQAQAARASAVAARGAVGAAQAQAEAALAQAAALDAQLGAASRQAERVTKLGDDASAASRDQLAAQADGLGHQLEAARKTSAASGYAARAATEQDKAASAQALAAELAIEAASAAVARAQVLVDSCTITAPRSAFVDEVFVEAGELAMPGTLLVRLVDLSRLEAVFYVPNAEVASVTPGRSATVRADALQGHVFSAKVLSVSREAEFTPRNVQTRSDRDRLVYPVTVEIEDPQGLLLPGMPVEVELGGGAP